MLENRRHEHGHADRGYLYDSISGVLGIPKKTRCWCKSLREYDWLRSPSMIPFFTCRSSMLFSNLLLKSLMEASAECSTTRICPKTVNANRYIVWPAEGVKRCSVRYKNMDSKRSSLYSDRLPSIYVTQIWQVCPQPYWQHTLPLSAPSPLSIATKYLCKQLNRPK